MPYRDRMTADAAPDEAALSAEITRLLAARAPESSICPSDVARSLGEKDTWRALMDPVRAAAARMADDGTIIVTQGKDTVDIRSARGPIRLRRGPRWARG